MLMFFEIPDPIKLWDANWIHLTDDLLYAIQRQIRNLDMDLSSIEL